jgi:hypothetical protein
MKNARLMAMGSILLFLVACAPNLVPPGWDFLGKRDVSFGADHDVFRILPRERALHRLLIVVKMNDVELFDVKVSFEKGDEFDAKFRGRFLADRDTQIIDLPGGERRVTRVDFRYKSLKQSARRAVIELWGK